MSADASIRILALDGIPEIREGDDLGVFIGNAIQRTAGALPLTREDVLVVTQKIVSKAEGAVVDLTTVTPRREAIKFAERFDRDPRQVEVVLREARRVVRMQNGVLITETAHGFVCANGGIDASNVGPGVRFGRDAPAGRSRRVRDADPRGHPGSLRGRRPRRHVRLVRPALALGHRRRRDRRVRACCRSRTCAASPTPTAGS